MGSVNNTSNVVMVVDDSEDAGMLLCILLKQLGFDGITVGTGREAITMAATLRPFLVLLDLRLPDMSGLDVCRSLRKSLGDGSRIVALTGWSLTSIRPELQAAGFDDWFQKPIEARTLQNLLVHAAQTVESSSASMRP